MQTNYFEPDERPELDSEIVLSGGGTPHGFIDDVTKLSFLCGAWTKLSKQVMIKSLCPYLIFI